MIEAVNSVVANASLLRQSGQQGGNARPEIESVNTFPLAPYVDQISMDTDFDTAVLEIRDGQTGDVLSQFPSESTLEARQRAESVRQRAELLRQTQGAPNLPDAERADIQRAAISQSYRSANVQAVAIAQQASEPSPVSGGAGVAQVAIAALSTGAQSGQISSGTVSVTA